MLERDKIDQQVHDLLDEAHETLLEMALPGAKDSAKAGDLASRIRECAAKAEEAGKSKSAEHLREVVTMLEQETSNASS